MILFNISVRLMNGYNVKEMGLIDKEISYFICYKNWWRKFYFSSSRVSTFSRLVDQFLGKNFQRVVTDPPRFSIKNQRQLWYWLRSSESSHFSSKNPRRMRLIIRSCCAWRLFTMCEFIELRGRLYSNRISTKGIISLQSFSRIFRDSKITMELQWYTEHG